PDDDVELPVRAEHDVAAVVLLRGRPGAKDREAAAIAAYPQELILRPSRHLAAYERPHPTVGRIARAERQAEQAIFASARHVRDGEEVRAGSRGPVDHLMRPENRSP